VSILAWQRTDPDTRDSWGRGFRRRRFALFLELIDEVLLRRNACRILDIGGEPGYWAAVRDLLGPRHWHVTLLNQVEYPVEEGQFASLVGDARDLSSFSDMSFDLVHSNSVIEHVGRWPDMRAMAGEVRRLAPGYFVQTPYFWFPVEPHCSTAFFHWMPESTRVSMLMRRPRGVWGQAPDLETAMRQIQSAVLLDYRMFATLFPDASIHRERFFGLTKSLIAVRHGG
jgi:SAM-dependent methyltransferase